ncbi:MAG: metallophosphoesterase [Butyrivibrio sp.]|nr:metallophosphoesterase [Butyrivibrio sp.]
MIIYYCAAAITLLIIICVAVIYHDTHNFVVRSYDLESDKIKGDMTFVLLSDLHGYKFGKNNEKLVDAITAINPDAILCAGDLFTADKHERPIKFEPGFELASRLSEKFPFYYGNGNHEYRLKIWTSAYGNFYDRYKSRLKKYGVVFLENESVEIKDKNIRITGLDLNMDYYRKVVKKEMEPGFLNRTLGGSSKKEFQILIAHNPQYFKEYAQWGADLTVSGHVHGGIVRIPGIGGVISPSISLFPKYDGGHFEIDKKHLVLSRGLGTHTIQVRMFNPCEVDVIRIHEAK